MVDGIDHVHIEVADRDRAARWYRDVLGLVRHEALSVWADDPMGPLILATKDGSPTLSLFARGCAAPSRDSTIAFRTTGAELLDFLNRASALGLKHESGGLLQREHLVDHDLSWSVYFYDPDGNRLEMTSYDYAFVAAQL